eukprot:TRINITY_DN10257_c0_g1_i4.p1 TRINITY_DN10257_c0_g1~~TRINITY_DN10257_c0_g1_i4.p1  ORF type:complete len:888 (+),score=284.59 TRINITY_DN10257_c0_g1_i4:100-2763(+)
MSDGEDDLLAELEAELADEARDRSPSPSPGASAPTLNDSVSGVSSDEFLQLQAKLSELQNQLFDAEAREKKYRSHIKKLQDASDSKPSTRQLLTNVFKRAPSKSAEALQAASGDHNDGDPFASERNGYKSQIQALKEEMALHKQTKDELARQVKATKVDVDDQRRIYKRSMAELSQKNTELTNKVARLTEALDDQAQELSKMSASAMAAESDQSPEGTDQSAETEVVNTASSSMSSDAVELVTQLKLAQARELELNDKVSSLEQELAMAQQHGQRAHEDKQGEVKDNETLREQLKQANARSEELQQTCRQLQSDLDVRNESLDKTQTELEVTRSQLEDMEAQLKEAQHKAEWAVNNIDDIKLQRDQQQSRTEQAQRMLAEAKAELQAMQQAASKQQQDHLKSQAKLESKLSQAQQAHDKAVKQLTTAHAKEVSTIETRLRKELTQTETKLQKEVATLKSSLDKERKDADERLALAARLRAEGRDKDEEISRLQSALETETEKVDRLQQQVKDLQAAKTSLTQELHAAKDVADELASERAARQAMEKESEMLLGASQTSSESLKALQGEMSALKHELARTAESKSELEQQLQSLQTELNAEMETRQAVQEKHQARVAQATELTEKLDRALQQADEHRQRSVEERESLTSEITYLTGQLNEEMQQREMLATKVKDLQEEARLQQKKSAHAMKDMAKQLAQANRKLASNGKGDGDNVSLSSVASDESRASSKAELVSVPLSDSPRARSASEAGAHLRRQGSAQLKPVVSRDGSRLQSMEPGRPHGDFSMDKLKAKIRFLETHIQELTDTIKAKNKLLQHYYLREKRGQLASPTSIPNASGKKPKSSLLGFQTGKDAIVTLQVNAKLQEVLEDTILQNLALKETIDSLTRD